MLSRALEGIDQFQRSHAWLAFPVAVIKKFGDDRASRLAALVSWPRTFFGDTLREHDREALLRYAKVQERPREQVVDVRFEESRD